MKGLLLASAAAAVLASATPPAFAEDASPHSFSANVGLFSQYVFRGLSQTNKDPAIQGGFDYAYDAGPAAIYVGTWGSNISWLSDANQVNPAVGYSSSSLELDFYGGVRGAFGKSDFTWDVGYYYYWYPGTVAPGAPSANTAEIYGALGWKWLSAKYSYSVLSQTFGVRDSSGTWYLDFSGNYPVGDTGVAVFAHYGIQHYAGTDPGLVGTGASNDTIFGYSDWKVGASYDLGKATKVLSSTTLGAYYAGTSGANNCGYGGTGDPCTNLGGTGPYPKDIAGGKFVVYLQRTF
jgi:uncharacterized protein (TIGR02001 family)